MKLYADQSSLFVRQLLADCLVVGWVVLWGWIGHAVHDSTLALADPGHRFESSASGLSDSLSAAGAAEVDAVETLAGWLGWSIALVPILVVLGLYLPGRVRFVRNAGAGQRFVDADPDLRLFALRAMAHQPMHVLARVSDDPVTAWQLNDQPVVRALAEIELREVGLVPPTRSTS